MYQHKKTTAGNVIENYKCHTCKCPPPPHKAYTVIPRANRTQETTEDQKRVNNNKAYDDLRYSILCNFVADDFYITLTYENEPTPEDAKGILDNFKKRLKYFYHKQGAILKYILVTEYERDKKNRTERIHHHILINRIIQLGIKKIKQIWGQGRVDYRPYRGEADDADGISNYFIKEEHSAFYKDEKIFKTRYTPSRNLKKPKISKAIVPASTFRETMKPPKGYYLDKSSIRRGTTKWGYPYLFYRFIKDENSYEKSIKKSRSNPKLKTAAKSRQLYIEI